MYNSQSRPHAGGRPRYSGKKFYGKPRFNSRSSRPAPKKGLLNIANFINKPVTTTEEVVAFAPEHKFSDFALDPRLIIMVKQRGYENPTPIQDKVIPYILKGADVVGLANTGTGKTAAFMLPLINKVLLNSKEQVLILAPTRELALQIQQEFRLFSKNLSMYSVACVGGVGIGGQIRELRFNNSFFIGTPGRVIDLMKRGFLKVENISSVVLDEADRMLDMGFIDEMRFIIGKMPKKRHTLFFSATMSNSVKGLVNDFLSNPVTISVKTKDTPNTIEQDVVRVKGENKVDVLFNILKDAELKKVLVFGRTKHGVEKLCNQLTQRGVRAESIHGNKSHGQRQQALRKFKENRVQALIATDVAARGLDIEGITHVINFELPATYEDYVHRIGRTGRSTHKGKALTFVD